jgi:HAE1 family hydrophobic/amphiphilic exporter-1
MNLIQHSIRRPVAVTMASMVVLLTGLFSVSRLPLELTPDVDFPRLTITTPWPDSSPEAVEAYVTAPLEAVASTSAHVREVTSQSDEGRSQITVSYARNTHMDLAAMELSEKLSLVQEQLPYGAGPPSIGKYVPREFRTDRFFAFRVTGPFTLPEVRRIALEKIRPALLGLGGVAEVRVIGGRDREVQILLDKAALKRHGVSLDQIRQAVRSLGLRRSLGVAHENGVRFSLAVHMPLASLSGIEALRVNPGSSPPVILRDIARIRDAYGEPASVSRIDGQPALVVSLERETGSNTIDVSNRIGRRLETLRDRLPRGVRLIVEEDQSRAIRENLSALSRKAVFSVLVIFLVLMSFLRTVRAPLVILSTIFFSVLLTLNLFRIAGISLNLLTLAGLTLGLGMLVDNAIVVVENITRHRSPGRNSAEAAAAGTTEVVQPIIASTLTTVVAFIPFLYMTGKLRLYYLPFTMAVGLSLLSSLITAFTLTPALHVRLNRKRSSAPAGKVRENRKRIYPVLLNRILRCKGLTVAAALLFLAGSAYVFDRKVTKGSLWSWRSPEDRLTVSIRMPKGAELFRTDRIIRKFEETALEESYVDRIYTNVYPERANMTISFSKPVTRSVYPYILKEKLIREASLIAGIGVVVYGFGDPFSTGGFMSSRGQYRIEVLGYNYDHVREIARDLERRLSRYSRVRDVNIDAMGGYYTQTSHEIVLAVDRRTLSRYQLDTGDVLTEVEGHLKERLGWYSVRLGGEEVDYSLKFAAKEEFSMEDLENLEIHAPSGERVRLRDISSLERRKTPGRIVRRNQQYQRLVSFDFRGPYKLGNRVLKAVIGTTHVPPGYSVRQASYFFLQEEEKRQIFLILGISLFLVFLVTAGLFESLLHPFLILLTVPLSLAGVFLIFYATGTPFGESAYIGLALLGGIVVNDSILLVDQINRLRGRGMAVREAILKGASDRLRPILMTTFTTIGGLLPLVLLDRASESVWHHLALATIGGLLCSTVMVLTVIPALYGLMERWRRKG